MEEQNLNQTEEMTAEASQHEDGFLDGFGEEHAVTDTGASQPAEEAAREEQPAAEPADGQPEATAAENPAPVAAEPKVWKFKHMDEEKTLTADDITDELLQRGLDYERIRTKYDEAKPVIEMMRKFAESANMSLQDYITHIRTEAKKASGMTTEEAKRHLDLEDREAAVSAKEAAQKQTENAKQEKEARIRADLQDFAKAFPEEYNRAKSDPKAIPDEVWAEVNSGKASLTAAFARHMVAAERAKAAQATQIATTQEQNRKNAERSTGSMQSAGNPSRLKDPFEEGFGF